MESAEVSGEILPSNPSREVRSEPLMTTSTPQRPSGGSAAAAVATATMTTPKGIEISSIPLFSSAETQQVQISKSRAELKSGSEKMRNGQSGSGIEIMRNGKPSSGIEVMKNGQSGSGIEVMKNGQSGSGIEVMRNERSGSCL